MHVGLPLLNSVLTGATLALAACPLDDYFPKYELIWTSQHALALAECQRGLPWLLLLSYRGCLGLGYVP